MTMYYLIAMCVISLVNAGALVFLYRRQINYYFTAIFLFIVVANFGHLLLASAQTLEGVIAANKACYLGSSFLPMFEFFAVLWLCRIKFPTWGKFLLGFISLTVFALACTIGHSDIYYKSVEYVRIAGVGGYRPEFAPSHILWVVMLAGYALANIVLVDYAVRTHKDVSSKTLQGIVLLTIVTLISFTVSCIYDCDSLIMPAVYIIDEIILFFLALQVRKLDISATVMEALTAESQSAFVAFSSKGAFLGCNSTAGAYFPEFKQFRMDRPMPEDCELFKPFSKAVEEFEKDGVVKSETFSYKDRYYRLFFKDARRNKHTKIYLFRIEDETKIQTYIEHLDSNNIMLKGMVQSGTSHIHAIQEQMIVGMAVMVENRDNNTGGHIKRTSRVVQILAEELKKDTNFNYNKEFYEALVAAAPMHDLGKVAIADKILRKPGKFDPDEFDIMKTHAAKGAYIVKNLLTEVETPFFVEIAKNVACYHHERWDGSGYPEGLSGENIPFEARVMAVADVYDALVSKRCYKDQMSFSTAFNYIVENMGKIFDPSLKWAFINSRTKLEAYYKSVEH